MLERRVDVREASGSECVRGTGSSAYRPDQARWVAMWQGCLAGRPADERAYVSAVLDLLLPYFRKRVAQREQVEELIQGVMEKLFGNGRRGLRRYDPERASMRTYLLTVAASHYIDYLRSAPRGRRQLEVDTGCMDGAAGRDDAEARLITREWMDLIGQLRPEHQACLLLHMQGLRDREIAQALGIPMGTVATRIRLARSVLRHWSGLDTATEDPR